MSITYQIAITPTNKANTYNITYLNVETKTIHTFDQESTEIMPEEMEWMWKDRRNQLSIGRKLFRFLDGKEGHLKLALEEADRQGRFLMLQLTDCRETTSWPFELLAYEDSFLLPDRLHLVRHVEAQHVTDDFPPRDRPLRLLFLACVPLDVMEELDFEQEEEAIFKATEQLAIDLDVEDTGSLQGLRRKLEQQQYDVVHLSGYTDIGKKGQPLFVMETEAGYRHNVSVEQLWREALCVNPPQLMFISGGSTGDAIKENESVFARMLVDKYHVPTVLGWGQWISDMEATEAAEVIYKEISRGKTLIHAVQRARYHLTKRFPSVLKPAWPQLRLFSNGVSLNALVEKEQKRLPQTRRLIYVYLKNSEVKVLLEGFVGRRRQLQQSFRALAQTSAKVGLLILGTGGLGKSCLAGKISERFKQHTLITVHGKLDAITIKQALKDAFFLSGDAHGKNVLTWEMEMKDILGILCRSSFKEIKYLILLDDFEQNLESSGKGEPDRLLPEAAELLNVLLDCLPETGKITQMMITCRYRFSGIRKNRDLIKERLEWVWLAGFREPEQKKKLRELPHISKQTQTSLTNDLLTAGCGNPRLMEWVDVLVGQMKSAEVPELLKAVRREKEEFIRRHVIRKLLEKGGKELTRFLQWFAIYRRPVLKEGAKEVGEKAGLKTWEDLLHRGMDFSLIEHDQARSNYLGTPLIREEFFKKIDNLQACHEAAFKYYKTICDDKSEEQFDPILVEEWIFHALACGEEEVASYKGRDLISHLRIRLAFLESKRVGLWILEQKKHALETEYDASLLNNLGYAMYSTGDYLKANDYYQEALTIWKGVYGDKHQDVAIPLNNLGVVSIELGEPNKAIDYYQEALVISKDIYGEAHPQVATVLNSLGAAWYSLGNAHKALDYYQEALTIFKDAYGEKAAEVANILNNIGFGWVTLGDPRKAIGYFQEALTIGKDVYGNTHPQVAVGLNALGKAWFELGDSPKAISYYQEALAIREAVFGSNHPEVAVDLNAIGGAWEELGASRKAIEYFERALTIDQVVYGLDHPDVASDSHNLGVAWATLGAARKAINYYQEALNTWEKVYGKTHPQIATTLNSLGAAWYDLGKLPKAIEYFENALTIDEKIFGRGHPDLATDLNNLGSAWAKMGNPRKAIDYYREAITIRINAYGESHQDVATGLCSLGAVYYELDEPQIAISYYQEALTILKAIYGTTHPSIATTLNNLGAAYYDLDDPLRAIGYYQEALAIDNETFEQEHPNTARDLHNLGTAYFKLGQKGTAKKHITMAYKIFEMSFGKEHPDTKAVADWLEKLKEEL